MVLPGGVEIARHALPALNHSVFETSDFDNVDTVTIQNAPGWVLTYENLPSHFNFNRAQDCVLAGQMINDTLQMCVQQVDQSIAVGKDANDFVNPVEQRSLILSSMVELPRRSCQLAKLLLEHNVERRAHDLGYKDDA